MYLWHVNLDKSHLGDVNPKIPYCHVFRFFISFFSIIRSASSSVSYIAVHACVSMWRALVCVHVFGEKLAPSSPTDHTDQSKISVSNPSSPVIVKFTNFCHVEKFVIKMPSILRLRYIFFDLFFESWGKIFRENVFFGNNSEKSYKKTNLKFEKLKRYF